MSLATLPRRVLVSHAAPEAFAPLTRSMLTKLGYSIVDPDEFQANGGPGGRPDLRLVDERSLAEVPEEAGGAVPIVVLSGRHGVTGVDSRVVGAVRRPAGLHELYRLVQQVLEDTPRTSPRVATHLPAHCVLEGREWSAAVLSLSENGCLLRSPEPLFLGARFALCIELPRSGPLELQAELAYQLVPDIGVVFSATSPADRAALSAFVREAITRL